MTSGATSGQSGAEDRPGLTSWGAAVAGAFGLGGMTVASWGPRMPAIRSELHVGTATLGLLLACGTIGSIAGLFLARPALRRLGGRGAVRAALLSAAAGLALLGMAAGSGSAGLAAPAFALAGCALGALDVAINVEGAALEGAAGRSLLPLLHAAWSAGAAAGAGIGALCAATGVAPEPQFLVSAGALAVTAAPLAGGVPAVLPSGGARTHLPTAPTGAQASRARRWLQAWGRPRLLLIGLVLFGAEFGEGSANNWLALAARQGHGQPAATAALLLALFALSEASARTLAGPLVDRIGRVAVLRCTVALGAGGVALFITGATLWVIACGVVLWGIGVSMGFPLGMAAAADGKDPPAQVSAAASVGYLSSLVGPPAIGLLAASAGLLPALWCIALLFGLAAVAAGSLRPRLTAGA